MALPLPGSVTGDTLLRLSVTWLHLLQNEANNDIYLIRLLSGLTGRAHALRAQPGPQFMAEPQYQLDAIGTRDQWSTLHEDQGFAGFVQMCLLNLDQDPAYRSGSVNMCY